MIAKALQWVYKTQENGGFKDMRIKLFSAIQGKKLSLIGEGDTIFEAIIEAGLSDRYPEIETLDDIAEYIQTAHSDYVIEEVQEWKN